MVYVGPSSGEQLWAPAVEMCAYIYIYIFNHLFVYNYLFRSSDVFSLNHRMIFEKNKRSFRHSITKYMPDAGFLGNLPSRILRESKFTLSLLGMWHLGFRFGVWGLGFRV